MTEAQQESLTDSTPTRSEGTAGEQEASARIKDEETQIRPIEDHLSEIPDGGLRAWLSVLGGYVIFSRLSA